MADEPLRCPTCHSQISLDATTPTGPTARDQGSLGTDNDGNPVPRWSDDPLLTKNGLSGDEYTGQDIPNVKHIEELQDDRINLETELGITPPTDFSTLTDVGKHIRKTHLTELRESTEKILDAIGSTLEEYFIGYNSTGSVIPPGPNDTIKSEWTDVARGLPYLDSMGVEKKDFDLPNGSKQDSPTFPPNTRIRAIHFEDLRHAILLGWREFWSATPIVKIAMPDQFSASVVNSQSDDDPTGGGSPPNYPGISYGESEIAEFYIDPNPHKVWDTSSDSGLHHASSVGSATDAGKFGFPTGLDIHPTDGGNKFIYQKDTSDDIEPAYGTKIVNPDTGEITYVLDRTWIVEGYCRTGAFDYIRKYLYAGGTYCPYEHLVIETYGGLPKSTTQFEILDVIDPLVEAANANANTLQISVTADSSSYVSGPVYAWIPPHAWGWGKIDQLWEYGTGYSPISRGFYDPASGHPDIPTPLGIGTKAKFSINFKKDTSFKFFAETDYSGGDSKSNPSTIVSKSQWAASYLADMKYWQEGGALLEENGVDPSRIALGTDSGEVAPVSYGYASLSLIGIVNGYQSFIIRVIFDRPPDTYTAIATGTGQFGGQSYVFAAPSDSPVYDPGLIAIFLGDGNVRKGTYDYALCLEDIFYAWSQLTSGSFYYTSHKKKDDTGKVVEDPNGSPIDLVYAYFFFSGYAISGFKSGSITGLGWPGCGIVINPATIVNTKIAASLQVSALRIQNNTKNLQGN